MIINKLRAQVNRTSLLLALPVIGILVGAEQFARIVRHEQLRSRERAVDLPERVEQALAPMRHLLPPRGTIGYVSPEKPWTTPDATRAYFLTQYALAPRLVILGSDAEYVIYLSLPGEPLRPEAIPLGMRVLAEGPPHVAVLTRVQQ